ncbi:hypothetical protein HO133_011097 [Letharia lupina]|uniref:Amidoligase enzyme-domain-containing protein n=1 Tax=Letharia lupina TaxID=560253 RepID=A0A8H6CJ23_9LECA|nr:uncharacterized protein HO133_011097 [Letharia lupina]KAF6224520.1 hypothetical protein HO133_011097 [Letharia lupina]
MPKPLNLTFGIEFECIVSFDPTTYKPALHAAEGILWEKKVSSLLHEESKLCILFREHLVHLLRANGFPTYDVTSAGGNQKWTVSHDTSIDIKDGPRSQDGFLECDIEITSPAMRFCPKALRRVQHVIRTLTKHLDVSVNPSCGLHVHVGNQKAGFPLQTLKHFCILTALFEYQLNSLHPAHRIGNCHAKGPSAAFKGHDLWDTVRAIQGCETEEELVLLYADKEDRPDRCFAYNLCPMVFGSNKTIEFRQHEGTLEWSEIMNWVQVAGGMVDAMHDISSFGLAQLIGTCAFDPRFSVSDLLRRLRLKALVPYYSGHLHMHQRPEPVRVRGGIEGNVEGVPHGRHAVSGWNELERRHKFEKLEELERLRMLAKRHELERRRERARQNEAIDARRATSEYEGEE